MVNKRIVYTSVYYKICSATVTTVNNSTDVYDGVGKVLCLLLYYYKSTALWVPSKHKTFV